MSFAQGRATLAIPGPSPVPDRVLRAMHRPSPDIYGDELARENLALNLLQDRVELAHGDYLGPLALDGWRDGVQMVVSNPPYIRAADHPGLQPEVAQVLAILFSLVANFVGNRFWAFSSARSRCA